MSKIHEKFELCVTLASKDRPYFYLEDIDEIEIGHIGPHGERCRLQFNKNGECILDIDAAYVADVEFLISAEKIESIEFWRIKVSAYLDEWIYERREN